MVVLAASILSKSGKVLLSRHFVEMHRVRIEGLLAAFPKLIGTGTKQHTFVETESVRYVYQPMDAIYLLVVTNKSSNIIEDLETLRLLAKLIPEYCQSIDEEGVGQAQFELIFAFDEAVALGYRENVKPDQIRTYTEMQSEEEELFNLMKEQREKQAIDRAKQRADEIAKQNQQSGQASSRLSSLTSGVTGIGSSSISSSSNPVVEQTQPNNLFGLDPTTSAKPTTHVGRSGPLSGMRLGNPGGGGLGAKLGGVANANQLLSALEKEGDLSTPSAAAPQQQQHHHQQHQKQSVHVGVEEKVAVQLDREGGLKSVDVMGTLKVMVQDPNMSRISLHCTPIDPSFQIKANPKVNREAFNQTGVIALTDPSRGFPTGPEQTIVRWKMPTSTDESKVPLMLSCWPSEMSDGGFSVTVEYELMLDSLTLNNIVISIPCLAFGTRPTIIQGEGEGVYDDATGNLLWRINKISNANANGMLEFEVVGAGAPSDSFFPIDVAFSSDTTYSGIQLLKVLDVDSNKDVVHSSAISLVAEKYTMS